MDEGGCEIPHEEEQVDRRQRGDRVQDAIGAQRRRHRSPRGAPRAGALGDEGDEPDEQHGAGEAPKRCERRHERHRAMAALHGGLLHWYRYWYWHWHWHWYSHRSKDAVPWHDKATRCTGHAACSLVAPAMPACPTDAAEPSKHTMPDRVHEQLPEIYKQALLSTNSQMVSLRRGVRSRESTRTKVVACE